MTSIYDPYYYNKFHIDLTNQCNGKCSFCARASYPELTNKTKEIDFGVFKKVFNKKYLKTIHNLLIGAVVGDPIFYSKFYEVIDYISDVNDEVELFISTNGSMRSRSWWKELGKRMAFNKKNVIRFSIDGLEDTNSIYRGTDYNRVVKNLEAYINSGGRADWQVVVFRHNEHQLQEIKTIAKNIGCLSLLVIGSRSYCDKFQKPSMLDVDKKTKNLGGNKKVICLPIEKKMMSLTCEGMVYPCLYYSLFPQIKDAHSKKLYFDYLMSISKLDMSKGTLEDALNSPFFKHIRRERGNLPTCKTWCQVAYNGRKKLKKGIELIKDKNEDLIDVKSICYVNQLEMRIGLNNKKE